MPRLPLVCLCCAALAGCGHTDANIYGSPVGQGVVGNEAYVTVSNVWNDADALPLAAKHCGQYGKIAKYARREGYNAVFDCVAK
jgi:hypothetical protein